MIAGVARDADLCLGACEPAVSLGCGVSPELRSVLRARLPDSSVLETPGRQSSDREEPRMETIVERPAALDVHKAQVTACVRFPAVDRTRGQEVAQFQTTVRGLLVL